MTPPSRLVKYTLTGANISTHEECYAGYWMKAHEVEALLKRVEIFCQGVMSHPPSRIFLKEAQRLLTDLKGTP